MMKSAPDSIAFLSNDTWENITNILTMGGIEKGENDFSVWTKGACWKYIKGCFF